MVWTTLFLILSQRVRPLEHLATTFNGRSGESITPLTNRKYRADRRLGIVHDEDAADVELHPPVLVAEHQVEWPMLRDVQQGPELTTPSPPGCISVT